MDFTLGETQQAVARGRRPRAGPGPAAAAGHGPERSRYDRALWKELGQAGLLSLAVPAWLGGDGLGVLDTAVLLTEVGRRAAPVPALATLVLGVLPVVRWGDRDLQQALLAGVAAGDTVLTAAVREPSDPMPPRAGHHRPAAAAASAPSPESRSACRTRAAADWILVPASVASGGTGVVDRRSVRGRGDAAAHAQLRGPARVHAAAG